MKRICSHCFQEIKEGDKNCGLCKNPYIPPTDNDDDSEPIKKRDLPSKIHLPKGVLAIIISAVIAIGAGAVGTWLYLRPNETPESVALDGLYVLLNADVREFAARHAFMEAEIGLAIQAGRAASWDDAVLPFVWEKYNSLEKILDVLEKSAVKLSVLDSEELKEADRETALDSIFQLIIGDPDENLTRAEAIISIKSNIENVYRVNLDVIEVDDDNPVDMSIIVHVGLIDGKWMILSEALQ